MKALILSAGLLAGAVQAEVIECPVQRQGARLVGAGVYEGERKEAELMGAPKAVKNGIDAEFGFHRGDLKWLACTYEMNLVRWYRLSAEATRCVLKRREAGPGNVTATLRCR